MVGWITTFKPSREQTWTIFAKCPDIVQQECNNLYWIPITTPEAFHYFSIYLRIVQTMASLGMKYEINFSSLFWVCVVPPNPFKQPKKMLRKPFDRLYVIYGLTIDVRKPGNIKTHLDKNWSLLLWNCFWFFKRTWMAWGVCIKFKRTKKY